MHLLPVYIYSTVQGAGVGAGKAKTNVLYVSTNIIYLHNVRIHFDPLTPHKKAPVYIHVYRLKDSEMGFYHTGQHNHNNLKYLILETVNSVKNLF